MCYNFLMFWVVFFVGVDLGGVVIFLDWNYIIGKIGILFGCLMGMLMFGVIVVMIS